MIAFDEGDETGAHADAPETVTEVIGREHPRFASQVLTDGGAVRVAVIKSGCSKLLETIEVACPEGRHRALAITALEEACMWAVKAISHAGVKL